MTSLVRQQLTQHPITTRVQVIASTFPPHMHPPCTSKKRIYIITTLAWSKHVYCNTIAHLHHRRRWQQRQHLKGCDRFWAWIRSSEMDITLHSKHVLKCS